MLKCCWARTAPAHDGFEGGADGDLGFAEADVAADEAVHRLRFLHVLLRLLDGIELVGGLSVDEGVLELQLPLGVGRVRVGFVDLALCLHAEELRGVVEDRLLCGGLGLFPARAAELVEWRRVLPRADIARDQVRLFERDVEARLIGVFEDEHFLFGIRSIVAHLDESLVARDAVVEVDDQVALAELAEIGLGASRGGVLLAVEKPSRTGLLVASEELGVGDDGELGRLDGEAVVEVAEQRLEEPARQVAWVDEFLEALDLALVVEEHGDVPTFFRPGVDLVGEGLALGLLQDEVSGLESAQRALVGGGGLVVSRSAGCRGAGDDDVG